jgi:hypothetical protein
MDHDPGVCLVVRLDNKFQSSLELKYPRVDTVEGGGEHALQTGHCKAGLPLVCAALYLNL